MLGPSGPRASGLGITVVIPCFNEAENIAAVHDEVVRELGRYDLGVLFVDDGSSDATLERIREVAARDPRVDYLSFARNFGLEAAFSAGFSYAPRPWVLQLDADLQFPPAEAHRLVERAQEGYDAVFGIRVDRQDAWVRRAASRVHDLLARRLLRIELPAGASSFRLVRTDLARRVVDLDLGTPYFLATLPRLTRHWTTVPVAHGPRRAGEPKVSVRGLARHALELFMGHSLRPMAWASGALLGAALLVLLGGGLVAGGLPGAGALAAAVGTAAGFAALAVASRYLVHIGRGQPRAPLFLVRESSLEIRPEHALLADHSGPAGTVPTVPTVPAAAGASA